MDLKIGCCGFPVKMEEYFRKFRIVEVQKTFYQPPRLETGKRWRRDAPADFEFTIKAWQLITHESTGPTYRRVTRKMSDAQKARCGSFKPTDEVYGAWEETDRIASALGAGVIVFQCPPSFSPSADNIANMTSFFRTVDRKDYVFVWEPRGEWEEKQVLRLCDDLDLVYCADPFTSGIHRKGMTYLRLHGIEGDDSRYKGWDLKRLRDFCENEMSREGAAPVYVLFNNRYMMIDALRFEWILHNTGRIKDLDLSILESLCREIDAKEEDEKVQELSRSAERIVALILYTDYQKVDIDIEKEKLRELCRRMFPAKEYLYEMIYGQRFDRLWEQFRENEEQGSQ